MFSAIISMKTENASRTVIPSVIFSPESGGSQNPTRLSMVSHRHGNMTLKSISNHSADLAYAISPPAGPHPPSPFITFTCYA